MSALYAENFFIFLWLSAPDTQVLMDIKYPLQCIDVLAVPDYGSKPLSQSMMDYD